MGSLEEEPAKQREQQAQRPEVKPITHFQGTDSEQGIVIISEFRMVAKGKFLQRLFDI